MNQGQYVFSQLVYNRLPGHIVLLISDQPNIYYDDLVISVGVRQKTMQLGTYRYETRSGFSKTVPIVMIVDK